MRSTAPRRLRPGPARCVKAEQATSKASLNDASPASSAPGGPSPSAAHATRQPERGGVPWEEARLAASAAPGGDGGAISTYPLSGVLQDIGCGDNGRNDASHVCCPAEADMA